MERICVESTNYARLKGNHMFTMAVEKVKAFLKILLVSGYAGLPRQEIYWERREDCHNLVVSEMMTKTEFLEWKRYLRLVNNNVINEQCILDYQPTHHVSADESMVPYLGNIERNSTYMAKR